MAKLEVVVLLAAEVAIQAFFEYLEERREGLGTEFLNQFDRLVEHLREFPELASLYHRGYRRLLMRVFHRGIFYRIEGRRIVIADLLDLRQDPDAIRRRLSG